MQLGIKPAFTHVSYYGRGPHENYWDRKTGAALGRYSSSIAEIGYDYIRPQENGNRSDCRWVEFSAEDGTRLRITGKPLIDFSAWPYTMEDLAFAEHIHELPRRDAITLNIDSAQQGVGDLTSAVMGLPEDAQLLAGNPCEFSFRIRMVDKSKPE